MRIFWKRTARSFVLVSNDYALTLHAPKSTATATQPPQCLIHFEPLATRDLSEYEEIISTPFYGLVGMLFVKGNVFLAVITDHVQVCSPRPSETIYKVKDTEFFCLSSSEFDSLVLNRFKSESHNEKYETNHPCSKIRKLLINGFYYSRDFDLTSVLQNRSFHTKDYEQMYQSYNKRFLWNHFMIQELLNFRGRIMANERDHLDGSELITFLVRGFAKTANVNIGGDDCLITVISRISWAKASGPFGLTGVDEDGHVSNFIESEILFYNKTFYFSYTQIRGNVPLFYETENAFLSNKRIIFTKNKELDEVAFDKHFDGISKLHGTAYIVNGLKSNTVEEELNNRLKYFAKKKKLPIINVDLSREQLKNSPHKLSYVVKDAILDIGAFCYDTKKKVYIGKQTGVFRINALNSMEKPGLMEKIISKDVVEQFLLELGMGMSPDLVTKHDLLWDENNAMLINIYEKSLRRKGRKAFEGISTNMVELIDPIHDYISAELTKRKKEYSSSRTIKLFAGTFNVNGEAIDDLDISSWIYPYDDETYDVVVIGLEEVIELTASKMIVTDHKKQRAWELKIKKTLGMRAKYSMMSVDQLGGIVLMLFVRDDQLSEIKQVETRAKKTGLGGISANKGGVGVSFLYSSTRFCFLAAHLAAGLENVEQRQSDYKTIAKNLIFASNRKIKDHDAVIWVGDFNYRIDMNNDEVRTCIINDNYARLFEHDQLSTQMIAGESFPYYNEMEIKFAPTYKFNKGTKEYDTSEKLRIPAWTDRILSRGDNVLHQLSYDCAQDIIFSDHRPVYATFEANVVVIDETLKSRLTKELYEKRKLELERCGGVQSTVVVNNGVDPVGHGLPPPSSDKHKWWMDGGQPVRVNLNVADDAILNPQRPVNPFVESDVSEWIQPELVEH
ncbi:CYFA0S22e01640g1_1 [Cyberlindnera fabianii]|uniref:phosphoinositide 5-phosphatase n=1 Tax=Cyberlindnera fabianii TaxID=36022 RepID=A0A061B8J3_CYBFA|nr:CYFA0S22e01640g1_1 [Cyberlindnera fabianii]